MPDDRTKTGARDRATVAGEQDYEVSHFARRHGITQMEAQRLINQYGNERQKLDAAAQRLASRSSSAKA